MVSLRCFKFPSDWKGYDSTSRIVVYASCKGYDPNKVGKAFVYNKNGPCGFYSMHGFDGFTECSVDFDRVREVLTNNINYLRNELDTREKLLEEIFPY